MNETFFTERLLDWYDVNARSLPWRKSSTPYRVWISEIMAQQTQMDRVVDYFGRWMERFPDIDSLAHANEEDILKMWEGLGYYSRARNLHKAAGVILSEYDGIFPSTFKGILALPGVGPYTAGAISSIAFNIPEPAVDANVLRVFARLLDIGKPVKEASVKAQISKAVCQLLPEDRPGDFNQAIMELGALVCSKRAACDQCPVQTCCLAHERGTVAERPVLAPSKKTIPIEMATGVLEYEGRLLIQKRRDDDVWPGLWEFPGGCVEKEETPEQALVREYREEVELDVKPVEKIAVIRYSYTRYRVTMHCYLCRPQNGDIPVPVFNEAVEGAFVCPDSLSEYAFPAGHRRLIEHMRDDSRLAAVFA
ncbi:A/G-specific adenine glycosylase [uncultured Pseudodesulfovibrio sp.]|uniref:A/G-specific adenine glycosylase n=1 Tax=uncultured Pseudodesulfovibrio sp. TaxID=2035858 RepID=UPI0029C8EE01|nr:A/G-specific adenine glycosylase [uncultured Pseudodesulfovibrio sp.]